MHIMKKFLAILALAAPAAFAGTTTPLWLRDVKISPDGKSVAFCYKGDVWTVPADGGTATRLTSGASYEANPVWNPDGSRIAFASDRNGNMDVYIVDATGGAPRRLTYNSASEIPEAFTPDGKQVMFSASIQDPASSALFPEARMTELYAVPADGGATTRVLATPARYVSWEPDGASFLYQDVKGFEDEWRKHHTSGVTRDIWRYDTRSGQHTNLTERRGEDTNPAAGAAGRNYFLSERNGGTMNVYSLGSDGSVAQLTHFTTHPVRFLSRGSDGTLCFTYDGEIYTMKEGSEPTKLSIRLVDESLPDIEKMSASRGASEASPSPDGEHGARCHIHYCQPGAVEHKGQLFAVGGVGRAAAFVAVVREKGFFGKGGRVGEISFGVGTRHFCRIDIAAAVALGCVHEFFAVGAPLHMLLCGRSVGHLTCGAVLHRRHVHVAAPYECHLFAVGRGRSLGRSS